MSDVCPRCNGFLYNDRGEIRCLLCGWYLIEPVNPPIMVDEARRWLSILCAQCHVVAAVRGRDTCRACAHDRQPLR